MSKNKKVFLIEMIMCMIISIIINMIFSSIIPNNNIEKEERIRMLELNNNILTINLPEGKTNKEIISIAAEDMVDILHSTDAAFYGKDLIITGRITTHLAMWLGHKLAHVCNSISLFDPKLNENIVVISH